MGAEPSAPTPTAVNPVRDLLQGEFGKKRGAVPMGDGQFFVPGPEGSDPSTAGSGVLPEIQEYLNQPFGFARISRLGHSSGPSAPPVIGV